MVLVDSEHILDLLPLSLPTPPSLNLYVTTHVSPYVSRPSPQSRLKASSEKASARVSQ